MHQKLEPKVTLVTGSDFTHEKSLYNFLTSAKNHAPNISVIIYDLGMTPKQLRKIRREFSYEIRTFDYSKYPDFFNIRIAQGRFAWKPVIIAEVAKQRGGIVCWMDAGNIITGPLIPIIEIAAKIGFWRTSSQGTIGRWVHPGMLKFFNLPSDWKADEEMLAATGVAFDTQNKSAIKLLSNWAKYASIKECIAPEGSNRGNHRQDQALLSVLASMDGWPTITGIAPMPLVFHQDADANIGQLIYRRYKKLRNWVNALRARHKPHGNA